MTDEEDSKKKKKRSQMWRKVRQQRLTSGRPSWAMQNKLVLHELRAVAEEFLKDTDRDNMPNRKHEQPVI